MKGQKAIRILAPMIGFPRKKDNDAEHDVTRPKEADCEECENRLRSAVHASLPSVNPRRIASSISE
jgi:hypothetical protein